MTDTQRGMKFRTERSYFFLIVLPLFIIRETLGSLYNKIDSKFCNQMHWYNKIGGECFVTP